MSIARYKIKATKRETIISIPAEGGYWVRHEDCAELEQKCRTQAAVIDLLTADASNEKNWRIDAEHAAAALRLERDFWKRKALRLQKKRWEAEVERMFQNAAGEEEQEATK